MVIMTGNFQTNNLERKQIVLEGISLILSLFTLAKQQRLFPRTIMTRATRGQIIINSIEEIIKRFEEANYQDCRINAYPAFLNEAEETDYENGVSMDLFAPNILFIDLDEKDLSSKEDLDKIVTKILNYISKTLPKSNPLLIWSGRGYHIILPIQQTEALEHFEDFSKLSNNPSEEFLRFAKTFLSFNKADKYNTPSFKSCMLRVPYTLNSRCIKEDVDPEVKVIKKFDICRSLPIINNLLLEFMTFLSDRKLKEKLEEQIEPKLKNRFFKSKSSESNTIQYVEKLLTIPLGDYRKNAINLILAPYFVNILKSSDEVSFQGIKQWILKCDEVKSLNPSINDFDNIIKYAIKRAKDTGIKPLKFNDTLQYRNKKLYEMIIATPFVKRNYLEYS